MSIKRTLVSSKQFKGVKIFEKIKFFKSFDKIIYLSINSKNDFAAIIICVIVCFILK